MVKPKRHDKTKKRRRTSLEIEEEQTRTLYIRVPHTIKEAEEIKTLFVGNFTVKLPRQSSRHCHVIFPSIEDKLKNLKLLKKKEIDGKPIFACPPKPINLEKKKKLKQKKIVIPEPKDEPQCGKYILVSDIPTAVKGPEIKDVFPGSVSVVILKGLVNGKRQAKVKLSSSHLCMHYANKKKEWPTLHGSQLKVKIARKSADKKTKKPQKKSESLKVYDGEGKETTDVTDDLEKSKKKVKNGKLETSSEKKTSAKKNAKEVKKEEVNDEEEENDDDDEEENEESNEDDESEEGEDEESSEE